MATNKFKVGDTATIINTKHCIPDFLVGVKVKIKRVNTRRDHSTYYSVYHHPTGNWCTEDDNFRDEQRQLLFDFMKEKQNVS